MRAQEELSADLLRVHIIIITSLPLREHPLWWSDIIWLPNAKCLVKWISLEIPNLFILMAWSFVYCTQRPQQILNAVCASFYIILRQRKQAVFWFSCYIKIISKVKQSVSPPCVEKVLLKAIQIFPPSECSLVELCKGYLFFFFSFKSPCGIQTGSLLNDYYLNVTLDFRKCF